MAKAPRPGASQRKAAREDDQRILTITITRPIETDDGRMIPTSHTLAAGILPLRERVICRKATGLPVEAFTEGQDTMGMDSIAVLWWLARRMHGEATLTFDRAAQQWPDDLRVDEIEVEVSEPGDHAEDDDPES